MAWVGGQDIRRLGGEKSFIKLWAKEPADSFSAAAAASNPICYKTSHMLQTAAIAALVWQHGGTVADPFI